MLNFPLTQGIKPSKVYLPKHPDFVQKTVLDYLVFKFPHISATTWRQRFLQEKITDIQGNLLALNTPYQHGKTILYYRELSPDSEPIIPFTETILYIDDHLIVVDKPHFLPVIPTGKYVTQTLLSRLCCRPELAQLAVEHITPLHRLDKDTAGVMLFSHNIASRNHYQRLFQDKKIHKTYHAIAPTLDIESEKFQQSPFALSLSKGEKSSLWFDKLTTNIGIFPFEIRSRLVRGEQFFTTQTVAGEVNAITQIDKLKDFERAGEKLSLYELKPITGKKHQLRVHLNSLGIAIINDPLYPVVKEVGDNDFSRPLQLLARRIEFIDPITGEERRFESNRQLDILS